MSISKRLACLAGGFVLLCTTAAMAVQPLEIRAVHVDFDTSQIFIHGINRSTFHRILSSPVFLSQACRQAIIC